MKIPHPSLIVLFLAVPPTFFYAGAVIGSKLPKPELPQTIRTILSAHEGPACSNNGLVLNPKITPPLNFPGYEKSSLLAFQGEITTIVDDAWRIHNGTTSREFIIDNNVILDKDNITDYKVGDCVTLFYGLKRGFRERIYSIESQ